MNPLLMYAGKFSVPVGVFVGGAIEAAVQSTPDTGNQLKIALYAMIASISVAVIGGTALVVVAIISNKNRVAVPPTTTDPSKDKLIQEQAQTIVKLENEKERLRRQVKPHERD